MRVPSSILIALSVAACGAEPTAALQATAPPVSSAEHDLRFEGRWLVDQPSHALYEASVYDLHAGGRLDLVSTTGIGGEPIPNFEVGVVGKPVGSCSPPRGDCRVGVRCTFGEKWHGAADDRLVIAGECDDGSEREIVLRFNNERATNTDGASVDIVTVGGEPDWIHPGFSWAFRKCADPASRCP